MNVTPALVKRLAREADASHAWLKEKAGIDDEQQLTDALNGQNRQLLLKLHGLLCSKLHPTPARRERIPAATAVANSLLSTAVLAQLGWPDFKDAKDVCKEVTRITGTRVKGIEASLRFLARDGLVEIQDGQQLDSFEARLTPAGLCERRNRLELLERILHGNRIGDMGR